MFQRFRKGLLPVSHRCHDAQVRNDEFRAVTMRLRQIPFQGRQAVEWVIDKLDSKSTDDLLLQARRQLDDITNITKQGMEDIQNAAKKSFDEFQNLTVPPASQSIPKL